MRLFALFAAGLFTGPLLAADDKQPGTKDDMKEKDADAILGVWKVEKIDAGTKDGPPADTFAKVRFAFQVGGKLVLTGPDGTDKELKFKLDPAAKPKAIDILDGDKTTRGVYELTGDALKVCSPPGPPDDDKAARPTDFKAGDKNVVIVFQRVKEEKKDK